MEVDESLEDSEGKEREERDEGKREIEDGYQLESVNVELVYFIQYEDE